jgi:hypothetical protein
MEEPWGIESEGDTRDLVGGGLAVFKIKMIGKCFPEKMNLNKDAKIEEKDSGQWEQVQLT